PATVDQEGLSVYRLFLAMLVLAIPAFASAELYKWVDADGQIHYSERAPSEGPYETVRPAPPPADPAASVESPGTKTEEKDNWMEQEIEKRKVAAAEKEARDAHCRQAKARLAGLKQVGRIFTTDESGNRHYYSDQERDRQFAMAEQIVEQECD
ncbi:MAG: DUF4124 domain-containing protein, partial [Nevskiales bacterium]